MNFRDQTIDVLIAGYLSEQAAREDYDAVLNCGERLWGAAVVAKDLSVLKGKTGILTPHAGEFKRLTGVPLPMDPEGRMSQAKELAEHTGMTVLLKGRVDVIACADRVKLNRTGNAGMSVGGTGDVLAGIAGGLLSREVKPFDAARLAAFVNGTAGDIAYQDLGYCFLATDVAERIPRAVRAFIDRFLYV